MEIPIPDDAFRGRGLAVRTAGFFKGPRLLIDGTEGNGRRQRYTVRDNTGREVAIRLRTNHIDPIPKVEIDSKTIELARRLRWYEYVWMGLPVLLMFEGGALGALVGFPAVFSSARVFRSQRGIAAKYALSALISIAAVLVFFVLILSIQRVIRQ
jgi:hypothetical protein